MRKIGIALGALVALLVVAMIAIPLFVNVDKYRPEITSAVNQNINGQLELGHLTLSLWGQVRVEIAGLSLKDSRGQNIVSVKDAYFHLPFLPLLTGSPVVELNMDTPVVNVVKNHGGKLNVLALMKTEAGAPSAPSARAQTSTTTSSGASSATTAVAIPAIAANARLGFNLHDATIDYVDETQSLNTRMKNLNIVAKDISLSHPSKISIWSDFDTTVGDSLSIKGPGRLDVQFTPHVAAGRMLTFALEGKADFDKLAISVPGTFEKKSGVPANIEIALKGSMGGTSQELDIEKADVQFFNARIHSNGSITGSSSNPTLHYTLASNDIELAPWTELIPMLSQYQLGGKATLSAEVGGESTKLSYQAKIGLNGVTAKSPMLKEQPRIDGEVVIATDQVQKLDLAISAPGNELRISGKMLSFTAPQAAFQVTSSGMNLDRLIDFQALQARKKSDSASILIPNAYAERTEKAPVDPNSILARTTANVNVDIRSLQAENVTMTGLSGKLYLKDLSAGLESFSLKVFGGTIKASMACQLKPKQPTYKFALNVNGLDLGQAMQSQMAMFKNTATGKASFGLTGEGASFSPALAETSLKAKGALKLTNAELTTIDIGKMASQGITSSLSKVAGKVPGVGNRSFNPPHGASKYQLISSDFGISGGTFTAPNLVGKAMPHQGIDFKGNAKVGLKDQSIDAKAQIIDTYDMLHAKEFQNGLLCERGKPFVLPVGVGCTLSSPCYSYGDSAAFLLKVAMNNMLGQVQGQVRSQVQSQVQSQIQNQIKNALGGGAAPNLGDALKGLFGH